MLYGAVTEGRGVGAVKRAHDTVEREKHEALRFVRVASLLPGGSACFVLFRPQDINVPRLNG